MGGNCISCQQCIENKYSRLSSADDNDGSSMPTGRCQPPVGSTDSLRNHHDTPNSWPTGGREWRGRGSLRNHHDSPSANQWQDRQFPAERGANGAGNTSYCRRCSHPVVSKLDTGTQCIGGASSPEPAGDNLVSKLDTGTQCIGGASSSEPAGDNLVSKLDTGTQCIGGASSSEPVGDNPVSKLDVGTQCIDGASSSEPTGDNLVSKLDVETQAGGDLVNNHDAETQWTDDTFQCEDEVLSSNYAELGASGGEQTTPAKCDLSGLDTATFWPARDKEEEEEDKDFPLLKGPLPNPAPSPLDLLPLQSQQPSSEGEQLQQEGDSSLSEALCSGGSDDLQADVAPESFPPANVFKIGPDECMYLATDNEAVTGGAEVMRIENHGVLVLCSQLSIDEAIGNRDNENVMLLTSPTPKSEERLRIEEEWAREEEAEKERARQTYRKLEADLNDVRRESVYKVERHAHNCRVALNPDNPSSPEVYKQFCDDDERLRKVYAERALEHEEQLRREMQESESRLDHLRQEHEQRLLEERRKFMTFVVTLEKHLQELLRVPGFFQRQNVEEVTRNLHSNFNVRLLAMDSGLNFIMETLATQWSQLVSNQSRLHHELSRLACEQERSNIKFSNMIHCCDIDVDLKVGQTIPANVSRVLEANLPEEYRATEEEDESDDYDPSTDSLTETVLMDDIDTLEVNALVMEPGCRRVFVADLSNSSIKEVNLTTSPHTIHEHKLDSAPHDLSLLRRRVLVVSVGTRNVLFLVDIVSKPICLLHVLTTRRYYYGVAGCEDGTLVASCNMSDGLGPTCVDQLNLHGHVIRTVFPLRDASPPQPTSDNQIRLRKPFYLNIHGEEMLITDYASHNLYRVDLATSRLLGAYSDDELESPCQMAVNRRGDVFVASRGMQRVMVLLSGGRLQSLLVGKTDGGPEDRFFCRSVCLTHQGLLVSWNCYGRTTVLKAYRWTRRDLAEEASSLPS